MLKRNTDQRKAIREVFTRLNRPLSIQEVLEAGQQNSPGLGVATVYRTIKLLVNEGWLKLVQLPGEPSRYEVSGKPPHSHFYCRRCGLVYDIPGGSKPTPGALPTGFTLEDHALVLYGRCPKCNADPT